MKKDDKPVIKIVVACHAASGSIRSDSVYMPVQVGKALHPDLNLGIQPDDTGDSISGKNGSYCELTAMYWAWKNLKNVDYIGLCHYRRYFDFRKRSRRSLNIMTENSFAGIDLDNDRLAGIVAEDKVIIAKPKVYNMSLFQDYGAAHVSDDMRTTLDIVADLYPEQAEGVRQFIMSSNKLSHYNMFVMSWREFDRYCSWLFPILEEAERRINIEHYSPVQKRIFGYLAERLLNAYLFTCAGNLKISKYPVIWINENERNDSYLHSLQKDARYDFAYWLANLRVFHR